MKKPTVIVVLAAVIVLAAAAGAWLASTTFERGTDRPPVQLQAGTALPEPQPLPRFSLVAHSGVPIDETQLHGQWSLMFFGFTHCPEVCPTTLALLGDVRKRFGPAAPRVVLVSVDPERDTPAVLAKYLSGFDPHFLGITGPPAAVDAFTSAVGVARSKVPMSGDDYMVDHTAAVFAIDPQGRRAAIFSPPLDAAKIAGDMRRLMNGA